MLRRLILLAVAILAVAAAPPLADLRDYRTAETAEQTKPVPLVVDARSGTGYLGLSVVRDGLNLRVREVRADSPAAVAGVRAGDLLRQIAGAKVADPESVRERIQSKAPGDRITLLLLRGGKTVKVTATLAATSRPVRARSKGRGTPSKRGKGKRAAFSSLPIWKQPTYKLGVILIEFPDTKAGIAPQGWATALFSSGAYEKSATGGPAHGSLRNYFREQSFGKFHLTGKVFAPVTAAKNRGNYIEGSGTSNKTALPLEILGKLVARDGKTALDGFDGLCFVYAGAMPRSNRGSLYYPHQGALSFQGKRRNYILCPEGGKSMTGIGTFAVQFARLLGLPSLAARTENAGSEGLGRWCLMSDGGRGPRPVHLSAWCKEQLGWLTPTILDPTRKQKLILGPVQSSPRQCLKVLLRLDGSEYFLLENRTSRGFDTALPGHGLLIWRVAGGRPILEESHGVAGPTGPLVHLRSVPYPSKANRSFTPFTTPSSRSVKGGGLPVHLTNIRRLPDGRVTLFIGYEFD